MYFISFINIRYFHGVLVLLKSSQNVHVNQVEDPSYIQKLLGIHRISKFSHSLSRGNNACGKQNKGIGVG